MSEYGKKAINQDIIKTFDMLRLMRRNLDMVWILVEWVVKRIDGEIMSRHKWKLHGEKAMKKS